MKGRSGFTLLEVLVSLAIFVAAFASLSQLFTLGSRAAVQAALETQATVRAEAKMAEVWPVSNRWKPRRRCRLRTTRTGVGRWRSTRGHTPTCSSLP
ncbi:MAG: hypothetical protein Ct9H300mP1_23800 [Planctomycetaceae bacterium]|nr:MAG: hypothetical protein Ct9H300mP1_23800 [Planctomycetaceae bacterium]